MKAALKYVGKSRYTLEDLKEIITILRAPDGCPWDREQDHKSIRRDFLEECYEAIEAIDTEDPVPVSYTHLDVYKRQPSRYAQG